MAWPSLLPKSQILWELYYPCEISAPGDDTAGNKPPPTAGSQLGAIKEQGAWKGWECRREEAHKNCCLFIFISVKLRHIKAFFKLHKYSWQPLVHLEFNNPAAGAGRRVGREWTLRVKRIRNLLAPLCPVWRAPSAPGRGFVIPGLGPKANTRLGFSVSIRIYPTEWCFS